jgi:thiamine biosynthesis lipoprotein
MAAGLLLPACRQTAKPEVRKQTRLIMDTYVSISACAPAARADKAISEAFDRLEVINRKFNHLDSLSPVFAFNNRNEPLTDSEIVGVVAGAQAVSEASNGAFDITVEPLVRLWGFYSGQYAVPSQSAIDSCLKLVGYKNLSVADGRVTKLAPGVTIDLGGITKGYALKEAARVLRSRGVDSAIIDAGGDVYAIGKKGSENWKVGVRSPRADGILGVAAVSNLAVVTSGDYERFFFGPESVRYCHIIDPRTGWPARGVISTTVIMRDPVWAPGWSKVLFILGPDAMAMSDRAGGFEALLITDSMKAIMTGGLAQALKLNLAEAGIEPVSGN